MFFRGPLQLHVNRSDIFYIIHEFPFGEFGYYKDLIPLIDDLSDKIFVVEGELYHTLTNYFTTDKFDSVYSLYRSSRTSS